MKAKKGFTLIELLVVIAIIALLLSIIMPALKMAKVQAQKIVCKSQLSQLGKALELYEMENDYKRFVIRKDGTETNDYWMGKLTPYLGKDEYVMDYREGKVIEVLMCPSTPASKFARDPLNQAGGGGGAGYWGTASLPWEWLRTSGISTLGSYTINGWIGYDVTYDTAANFDQYMYRDWLKIPANVPLFGDGIWPIAWPRGGDAAPFDLQGCVNGSARNPYLDQVHEMRRFCIDRHNKQINMIFRDLHAETVKLERLWELSWSKGYKVPNPLPRLPNK